MEAEKILSSDFLDILFEGRNKEYGAYQLRRTYNGRMIKALVIVAVLLAAIATAVLLNKTLKPAKSADVQISNEVTIQDIQQEQQKKDEPPPPPPPPPPKQAPPPKVEMKAFTPPKVVKDEEVREPPPAQTELKETKIGTVNQAGIKDMGLAIPPVSQVDAGKGIVEVKKPEPEPEIFTKVEIDASYPGGNSAWRNFLERNLRGETPVDNGASPGSYTVIIQFVVDVAGNVSDVKPITNLGYGMEQEAVRVLKRSGKWKPAIQNGREVKAYRKQPITFQVLEN